MSSAVIKSLQVSGSTVEVLAVIPDDGSSYRLQTDGKLSSLVAAMQQATKKASDIKTKPEIYEGMTFDFTPVVVVDPVPTKEEQIRAQWFADYSAELTQLRLATLSPELQSRYLAEYGELR